MRVLVTKLQKVERVAFAPEGTHLFASGLHAGSLGYGDKDAGIEVFDLAGGAEPVKRLYEALVVEWFAPLPGGRLAVAHDNTRGATDAGISVHEWRAPHGPRLAAGPWNVWRPVAVVPDGSRLVAGLAAREFSGAALERGLGCWRLSSNDPPHLDRVIHLGLDRLTLAAAFAPDGRSFWTADWTNSGSSRVWRMELVPRDAAGEQPLSEPLAFPNQKISGLALGDSFAVAHDGPLLFVYHLAELDRKPKKVSNPAKRKHFAGFAIHPSGEWLATAGLDGAVTLWHTDTWEPTQSWTWDAGQARSICFSADGTLAAAGTNTGKIVVWDLDL